MTQPAIEVTDVDLQVARWPWVAPLYLLRGICLQVNHGEIFGLLGANGAGKTTLLRTVLGLLRPDAGEVRLLGQPARSPQARCGLGVAFEQAYFPANLTAREVVELQGRLTGLLPRAAASAATVALHRLGLDGAAVQQRRLGRMSKGMRQRVNLAQAMLGEPRLLVLDEPMSGLDPPGRLLVRDLLAARRAAGGTVVFSSHHLGDVEMLCDRVTVLRAGKVAYSGSPQGDAALDDRVLVAASEVGDGLAAAVLRQRTDVQQRQTAPTAVFVCPSLSCANLVVDQLRAGGARLVQFQRLHHALENHFSDTDAVLSEVG